MVKIFKLFGIAALLFSVNFIFAQSANKKATKADKKIKNDDSNKKDDKGKKDNQNQVKFMEPDLDATEYNFYDRKAVSQPLMPRMDLDTAVYQSTKKKKNQQTAFKEMKYLYPARPSDQWEIGVNLGYAFISGDVNPDYSRVWQNWGAGLTIRKSIGHTFSMRLQYQFAWMTGLNFEPDFNTKFNQALNGFYDANVNYYKGVGLDTSNKIPKANRGYFFYNYRTFMHDVALQAVVNLGNIRFYKERNMLNFYLFGGVGGTLTRTQVDALDANGKMYDFTDVLSLYQVGGGAGAPPVNARLDKRKEALKLLRGKLDGKFESDADRDNNRPGIFKNYQLLGTFNFGFGMGIHISKWVTLSFEQKFIITGSDVLDGYRWTQDEYPGFTRDNDNALYTSIGFNFHVGRNKVEPLWWLNPNDYVYRKIAESSPDKIVADLAKDDDEDGVPNYLDKEPNTKKGCPVDVRGVALDSDGDGIIDCDDKEPYSPPGYPVNEFGVAQIPPNPCCDDYDGSDGSDGGFGSNLVDDRGNPIGTLYDDNGNPIPGTGIKTGTRKSRTGDCSKIELPGVYFDADKYYIDPIYLGSLHQTAERMQQCPDMRLVITGFDASKNDPKYNEQLSWNRAQKIADYLVDKYGISRDRFIVKYEGAKKSNAGKSAYEQKMSRKVEFRYADDDEKGESNPASPHPGYKAGSDK